MKASTLVTALAEKSFNMAYFPGELNSSALRSYLISVEVYGHKIGGIAGGGNCLPLLHYISSKT